MSTFDELCTELDKDAEFVIEYERQKPYYDLLLAIIKYCREVKKCLINCLFWH